MPVVHVIFDRALDAALTECAPDLADEISSQIVDGLKASKADCQIMFTPGAIVSVGYPIYMSMHYRADEHRPQALVNEVLSEIGKILGARFGVPVRLRGFPVDSVQFAAVNFDPETMPTDCRS